MIKTGIALVALIALTSCMSYQDFNQTLNDCNDKIRSCQLNFYDSPVIVDEELQCAQDVHKARICFSRYKQCFATNSTGPEYKEEMPLVCWQCYMEIDSDASYYKNYRSCIQSYSKRGQYITLSLLLILALMLLA